MDSYDKTLANSSQKVKSKTESIDFRFNEPTLKEKKDNEMTYKNKKWGRVPKGYNPPTPDFLPQPPSSWFQSQACRKQGGSCPLQIWADQKAPPGGAPHYYMPPQIFRLCCMPESARLRIKS